MIVFYHYLSIFRYLTKSLFCLFLSKFYFWQLLRCSSVSFIDQHPHVCVSYICVYILIWYAVSVSSKALVSQSQAWHLNISIIWWFRAWKPYIFWKHGHYLYVCSPTVMSLSDDYMVNSSFPERIQWKNRGWKVITDHWWSGVIRNYWIKGSLHSTHNRDLDKDPF